MSNPAYPRAFGTYTLLERLGQGGMSEVDLARRTVDEASFVRFMAIKRVTAKHAGDDSFVRMFQDEARINAELQHENIAQVYDFGRRGDDYFIAMEYVPGVDLRQLQQALARRNLTLPLRLSLRVLVDVLAALGYAHSRVDTYGRPMNIVHRDVNPRNMMISVRGEVKLIDFGVAKSDNRTEQTGTFAIKGKVAYLAPEQVDGHRPVDGRSDLFAIGLVLHELIEGSSPFAGLSEVQILHRVLAGRIPPLQNLQGNAAAGELQEIHRKALAQNPDDRYRDAAAFAQALTAAATKVGGLADRAEVAAFVREALPDEVRSITTRLEHYRSFDPAAILNPRLPEGDTVAMAEPHSLSRSMSPPSTSQSRVTLTAAIAAAPKPLVFAAAGAGMVGVGAVALVIVLLGVIGWMSRDEPVAEAPVAAAPAEAPTEAPPAVEAAPAAEVPAASPAVARAPTGPPSTAPIKKPDGRAKAAKDTPSTSTPEPVAATPAEPAPAPTPVAAEAPPPTAPVAKTQSCTDRLTRGSPSGFLNVSAGAGRSFEVKVDGCKLGRTVLRTRLITGAHEVVVTDPATGQSWTRSVSIEEGRTSTAAVEP